MATFLGFNISVELPPFCGESAEKKVSASRIGPLGFQKWSIKQKISKMMLFAVLAFGSSMVAVKLEPYFPVP